mmetsp:Transcript_77151/g.146818  ORF Transcript_77151/g.146818 Transcript_77151/m.146818 type:complete len:85 (-) Transcript_77151:114-368(-)
MFNFLMPRSVQWCPCKVREVLTHQGGYALTQRTKLPRARWIQNWKKAMLARALWTSGIMRHEPKFFWSLWLAKGVAASAAATED